MTARVCILTLQLVQQFGVDVGSVDGGVTANGRTVPLAQEESMIHRANDNSATRTWNLSVAFQTKIGIALHE